LIFNGNSRIIISALTLIFILGLIRCEKEVPLSSFDLEYEPQYRIEGDFFTPNTGKSVLRIDRTFTIRDTLSMESSHIRTAEAVLRVADGEMLSTLSWRDSADAYPYIVNPEEAAFGLDSVTVDTQAYGAYKLDRPNFQLEAGATYELVVTIDGEEYRTTFSPYPAVDFIGARRDTVLWENGRRNPAGFPVSYYTFAADTARLQWKEDPDAYFYSVKITQMNNNLRSLPQVFAFPGPVLSLTYPPGRYRIVIGAMNRTFYNHYYLTDLPVNHETRNFFDGTALGYAGVLNERYLVVHIVP